MYLVTGATGNVGREVVEQLLAIGRPVRVFVRDPEKAARWRGRAEVAVGDFDRPHTFARALDGVRSAFVVNGAWDARAFGQLMTAAAEAGVPRVVFLSTLFAADPGLRIGAIHKEKEDLVRAAGLAGTSVRCGAFMTNTFQWAASIRSEGVVYNPMGAGQYAPIAPEDIAAVVAAAMTTRREGESATDEVLELTGPEFLTVPDQVRVLSEVLGRSLRCLDVPVNAAVEAMVRDGVPPTLATAVGEAYDAVRGGRAARLTGTVAAVTGREPQRFEAWARRHAARFR